MIEKSVNYLKHYPSGAVAGFDLSIILNLSDALGYNKKAILELIAYAEAGLRDALKKIKDGEHAEYIN